MDKTLTLTTDKDIILRDFLKAHFSSRIETLIKTSAGMTVGGENKIATDTLHAGEVLQIRIPEKSKPYPISRDCAIEIVYRDEDILVIYKPRGITSMATRGHEELNVFAGLNHIYGGETYRVVTRLDKDTEGLMLIALNTLSHSILSHTTIDKVYTARLEGIVENIVDIDEPIYRVPDSIVRVVSPLGKPSRTIIEPISYVEGDTIARIRLMTGRTHQIRVHTSYIGHPVKGDTLYSSSDGEYNSGQMLACSHLSFSHPFTHERLTFDHTPDFN
ncbi:MAG: RluA family pseudouridine synthase [Clostridia bacterium]|nr:RluA family pseudouridine synthase [Clostridia bacterium]